MSLAIPPGPPTSTIQEIAGLSTQELYDRALAGVESAKERYAKAEEHESEMNRLREEAVRYIFDSGECLIKIRDEKRYESLGYPSFTAFMRGAFKNKAGRAWNELAGAVVAREVKDVPSRKSSLQLVRLGDGDKMRAADKIARELAGDSKLTSSHYKAAVETVAPMLKPASERTGEEEIAYRREIGDIPMNAEAWVIHPEPAPDDAEPEEPERELTDDEYLESLEARPLLSEKCRKQFDAEAIAFRHFDPHRLAAVKAFRPLGNAAKKKTHGHIGPYLSRIYRTFQGNDPSRWRACDDCKGTGEMPLIGKCADCRGEGYRI